MMQLIGREAELAILDSLYESETPEFMAIYGRRRVGKTFLIRQFAQSKKAIFFNVTGIKKGARVRQLRHFTQQISHVFYSDAPLLVPTTWNGALELLTDAILKQGKNKKIILFLDELPWLATPKSNLLQELDYFWNQHWSNDKRIKLIICGSSASWIIKKIINNKGGLHNRITERIALEPFDLTQTAAYLAARGIRLEAHAILSLYMVTGGIAYYLSYVEKGLSPAQIVEKLAFTKNGILFNEFDNLFSSLFDNAENYIQVIRVIAAHRYGIGQQDLLTAIGSSVMGGAGLNILRDLEDTNFIMSFVPHEHKRQGIYYRLIDEYVYFYLKWIEPIKNSLQKRSLEKGYWLAKQKNPDWSSWQGYAFESFCFKHISAIRKALELPADAMAHSWRYVPRKGSDRHGAQIDLLFDRSDDAITVCEIKYASDPFIISKDYMETLKQKLSVYKEQTGTKKQLFLAFITVNGVKNNYYADEIISAVVTLDDFLKNENT